MGVRALALLGVLILAAAACGCAGNAPALQSAPPAELIAAGKKVTMHYLCSNCGEKIARESVTHKGFIVQCPKCGKPFLTM